jgi:hypothetical protein
MHIYRYMRKTYKNEWENTTSIYRKDRLSPPTLWIDRPNFPGDHFSCQDPHTRSCGRNMTQTTTMLHRWKKTTRDTLGQSCLCILVVCGLCCGLTKYACHKPIIFFDTFSLLSNLNTSKTDIFMYPFVIKLWFGMKQSEHFTCLSLGEGVYQSTPLNPCNRSLEHKFTSCNLLFKKNIV